METTTPSDEQTVERECLLFEAGDYPDRGLRVTEEDLRCIAERSPDAVPVHIEHLAESPFDGALGTIMRLRAVGGKLWGILRQPAAAWRFVQSAGAMSLSVALDVMTKTLTEVSFVRHPRIANARVFAHNSLVYGTCELSGDDEPNTAAQGTVCEQEEEMTTVRQFAEGMIGYLRGVVSSADDAVAISPGTSAPDALQAERDALRMQRAKLQLAEFKRQGLVRATQAADDIVTAMLLHGDDQTVRFSGEDVSFGTLFSRFLAENGAVVPMSETMRVSPVTMGDAAAQLHELACNLARKEGVTYAGAFARVCAANPALAASARDA